jgi:hypothetical protein
MGQPGLKQAYMIATTMVDLEFVAHQLIP